MFSCDEELTYMRVEKSFSKSTELIYHVDKTRTILEIGKINSRQLIETLTNDKEFQGDRFGYTITIQSIELTLIPKAGNGAQGLRTLTSTVSRENATSQTMLFRDQVIGVGEGDGNILVNIHLAIEGVNVMNGFLKETINNKGFNGLLSVTIAGFTSPESAKIIADLKLNIKCNIEYWYCEQSYVPIFLDFVDEECE